MPCCKSLIPLHTKSGFYFKDPFLKEWIVSTETWCEYVIHREVIELMFQALALRQSGSEEGLTLETPAQ